jgi:putative ABC transport system ATP-binding protein
MNMSVVLEAKNLSKVARVNGEDKEIIKNVDVSLEAGEFVAVMGPSGSGKSTLLYNVSGMDRPTSGQVFFDGEELSALPEKALSTLRLNRMGFVFQNSNLLKNLNIFDNIVLSAYMAKRKNRKAIDAAAKKLMERMGIFDIARNGIAQASGGQLQRVSICRALINSPALLFCDEPTGALNSKASGEVLDILSELNGEGTTILIATHDVKVASKTNRVLFLLDGKIVGGLELGDFKNGDSSVREMKLHSWLLSMGW